MKHLTLSCFGLLSLFALGCASHTAVEQQVAQEVAEQPPLPPGAPMARASREILFEADSLTPRQKERLRELHADSSREAEAIRQELSKNQLVLLKSLVNPKTKDAEIDVLKDRIVKLERRRTQHFLSTLDQAKRILGRRNSDDERFYRAFLLDPVSPEMMP